jgi:hypothetical protein
MKKDRRWMKSVIAAAADCRTVMPFQRGTKKMPTSLKPAGQARSAVAAR